MCQQPVCLCVVMFTTPRSVTAVLRICTAGPHSVPDRFPHSKCAPKIGRKTKAANGFICAVATNSLAVGARRARALPKHHATVPLRIDAHQHHGTGLRRASVRAERPAHLPESQKLSLGPRPRKFADVVVLEVHVCSTRLPFSSSVLVCSTHYWCSAVTPPGLSASICAPAYFPHHARPRRSRCVDPDPRITGRDFCVDCLVSPVHPYPQQVRPSRLPRSQLSPVRDHHSWPRPLM